MSENKKPEDFSSDKSVRLPEDKAAENNSQMRGLPKSVKIYLAVAIPLILVVIAVLIYVITSVHPPETNTQTSAAATTEVTTTPAATTTTSATTTTTQATTTTTTQATTTTEATTAAPTDEEVQQVLTDLTASEEAITLTDPIQREGVYTILVLGVDESEKLADTIMMMTLDSNNKQINLFSIPRDLASTSPNGNIRKINASIAGGIEQTIAEVKNVTGITPNRYVIVEYEGFEKLIDALGGIEVDVFMDMQYVDHKGNLNIDIKEGKQVLDGETALKYVRFRSGYAAADLKRIQIQQEFLTAVFTKMMTPSIIFKTPELVNIFKENVTTDLSLGEIIWFATHFYDMNPENIISAKVPTHSQRIDGQDFEVAYEGTLLSRINEKGFNPYTEAITTLNLTIPPEEETTAEGESTEGESTEGESTETTTAAAQ